MSTVLKPETTTRTRVTGTGSSVRVNLLPAATRERSRAARQRAVAGALAVVLFVGLGATYWWASNQVSKAEAELAQAEVVTSNLRAESAELASFKDLAARRDAALQSLTFAMSDEVSVAGVLQDFAATVPPDTEFTTLNLTFTALDEQLTVGSFALTARTLTSHAPGVERTLLQLGKVASFSDLYLNASALDEPDESSVATFSLDGNLGTRAATQRYADGLPEELR